MGDFGRLKMHFIPCNPVWNWEKLLGALLISALAPLSGCYKHTQWMGSEETDDVEGDTDGNSKALSPRGTCDIHATCDVAAGEPRCVCDSGWTGKGIKCADIDECEAGTFVCDSQYGFCKNTNGGYACECAPEFRPRCEFKFGI